MADAASPVGIHSLVGLSHYTHFHEHYVLCGGPALWQIPGHGLKDMCPSPCSHLHCASHSNTVYNMTVAYPFPQARRYLSELSRYEFSEACLLPTQSRTKG